MKGIKFIALALAFSCALGATAKVKKTKKSKAKTEKVDTCSVADFSYAIGMANTDGLIGYLASREGVDTTYMEEFMKGFDVDKETEDSKRLQAFTIGMKIRKQFNSQILSGTKRNLSQLDSSLVLSEDMFLEGFKAGIARKSTKMSMDSAQKVTQKQMEYYQSASNERKYGAYRKECEAFLKANAKKDSVKTLPSGVQYKVLVAGTGETPKATSKVKVNYEGTLIDGTKFDSSYDRKKPTSFECDKVIKGWTEALTNMKVGSKWVIYIPQELGYGAREAGKIKPFSALIFTVELLEIEK